MHNAKKQKVCLSVLYFVAVNCISVLPANASNPASKDYVDGLVNLIKTQISQLEIQVLPSGGTTGQVLAKASNGNFDTQWVNAAGGGAQYEIGDHLGADVIFFVYKDAAGVRHALVAAPADEPDADWLTAMAQCAAKNTGGYTWFLPDRAEITALWNNRFVIDPNDPNNNGGFLSPRYWSSTEEVPGLHVNSWYQYFNGNANQDIGPDNSLYSVRCIRTLP